MNIRCVVLAAVAAAAVSAGTGRVLAAGAAAAPATRPVGAGGWFVGAGLGSMGYVEPQYSSGALSYVYVQGGWRFSPHLALDVRAGTDLPGDCGCGYYYSDPNTPRVRSLFGAYLRATAPLSPHWDVYGLAGYAALELDAVPGLAASGSGAHSASFGLGLSWNILERAAIDLELLPRVAQGEGWRADALDLAFRLRL